MAETTIEWTATPLPDGTLAPGYSFNPWIGCSKVDTDCKNCYAETLMDTRYARVAWGVNGTRLRTKPEYWKKAIEWNRYARELSVKFDTEIHLKVFCASLSDIFEGEETVKDKSTQQMMLNTRYDLWNLIEQTKYLDWLLLTKRPENIRKFLPEKWRTGMPHNIWLGTSVGSNDGIHRVHKLIEEARMLRPSVLFISAEPLTQEVNFDIDVPDNIHDLPYEAGVYDFIDWIIIGGESGPNRRPFNPDWARSIRDSVMHLRNYKAYVRNIAFFMKQIDKIHEVPEDLMIREYPIDYSKQKSL